MKPQYLSADAGWSNKSHQLQHSKPHFGTSQPATSRPPPHPTTSTNPPLENPRFSVRLPKRHNAPIYPTSIPPFPRATWQAANAVLPRLRVIGGKRCIIPLRVPANVLHADILRPYQGRPSGHATYPAARRRTDRIMLHVGCVGRRSWVLGRGRG